MSDEAVQVDGGASDAVLGGQVGQGHLAIDIPPADGAPSGFGQFELLTLELADCWYYMSPMTGL
ncbi:hypothetical protein [Nonomuraea jabiensis]|uniref:Uncharacterized protein n=1 Tax=Nonomuraea jabiensis TaxID=882448 RepID=A0A7W9LFC2_9ACTN|nr:hypothetical protein [Nonomuraea jabiensis]MBB5781735.1 hypothetical protein [Nonomuraea jabiensis]